MKTRPSQSIKAEIILLPQQLCEEFPLRNEENLPVLVQFKKNMDHFLLSQTILLSRCFSQRQGWIHTCPEGDCGSNSVQSKDLQGINTPKNALTAALSAHAQHRRLCKV